MKRLILVALAFLIALPVFAQRIGFAAANQPAAASYSPPADMAFNASGGAITIKRLNVGLYTVTFDHLAKGAKARTAQISEWGSGAEQCAIRSVVIPVNTDNLVVSVHCISNTTGANVDARYYVYAVVVP